jgi:hypothetical protein
MQGGAAILPAALKSMLMQYLAFEGKPALNCAGGLAIFLGSCAILGGCARGSFYTSGMPSPFVYLPNTSGLSAAVAAPAGMTTGWCQLAAPG